MFNDAFSDSAMAELEKQKQEKIQKLNALAGQISVCVAKIEELNNKITQANNCLAQARIIPGLIGEVSGLMGSVGYAMQKGLSIDGQPMGENVSAKSLSISGDINGQVDSIIGKITTYGNNKYQEAMQERQKAIELRAQYDSLMASPPPIMGAAVAPVIPEVVAFSG